MLHQNSLQKLARTSYSDSLNQPHLFFNVSDSLSPLDGGDSSGDDSGFAEGSSGGSTSGDQSQSATPDPLTQLMMALCRTAMTQDPNDRLYLSLARVMAKVRSFFLSFLPYFSNFRYIKVLNFIYLLIMK